MENKNRFDLVLVNWSTNVQVHYLSDKSKDNTSLLGLSETAYTVLIKYNSKELE